MTLEQVWNRVVALVREVSVLRAQFEAHVKAHNTMPRHGSEIVEPMRQCEGEPEDDKHTV